MHFASLKAFCTVVEKGSISKAAKKLFVSQPSLSIKIQGLEKYYQENLLERTNRGIKPTDTGKLVYTQGIKALSILENIEREIERTRKPVKELAIGAANTIGNYALPCSVYIFGQRHPDLDISLKISNSEQVIERILNKTVAMGLAEGPLNEHHLKELFQEGIIHKVISRNELFLVVPFTGEFENVKSLSLEELKRIPLIVREQGSGIRNTLETTLAKKELTLGNLNVVMELNTIDSIISTIVADKGTSFLPKMALRKELHHKMLKAIRVEGIAFYHDFTLLYNPKETVQPFYNSFLKFIQSKDKNFC